jgi:hypothetical protein
MEYKPTLSSAIQYANSNKLEDWIHMFLCGEGNNKPFSDGLKLERRNFYAPKMVNLNVFERICGPEDHMKWQIPSDCFNDRVNEIKNLYEKGDWDMPPLIVYCEENKYELNDGNHRFEALKRLGIDRYWVILWETIK